MATIKLKTNGGFDGIDGAIGKSVKAESIRSGWLVTATAIREAGGEPLIHEYLFFKQEVEVVAWRTYV